MPGNVFMDAGSALRLSGMRGLDGRETGATYRKSALQQPGTIARLSTRTGSLSSGPGPPVLPFFHREEPL